MSLKMKLTSAILAFAIVLSILMVGVFSVTTATVNLGGKITFVATDVNALVTGSITGAKESPVLSNLRYSATQEPTEAELKSWQPDLSFDDEGSMITIEVTIQNLATDRSLYVSVSDTVGTIENLTKTLKNGTSNYEGGVINVVASSSTTLTMTMQVTNPDISLADGLRYGYDFELNNSRGKTVEILSTMQVETEISYYLSFLSYSVNGEEPKSFESAEFNLNDIQTIEFALLENLGRNVHVHINTTYNGNWKEYEYALLSAGDSTGKIEIDKNMTIYVNIITELSHENCVKI